MDGFILERLSDLPTYDIPISRMNGIEIQHTYIVDASICSLLFRHSDFSPLFFEYFLVYINVTIYSVTKN